MNWFLPDERYPEDKLILGLGHKLLEQRLSGNRGVEVYEFPGVGRSIYLSALLGLINGEYDSPEAFPPWLQQSQSELAGWLRGAPKRKSRYFLDMANLASYDLLPHARSDPRGQFDDSQDDLFGNSASDLEKR